MTTATAPSGSRGGEARPGSFGDPTQDCPEPKRRSGRGSPRTGVADRASGAGSIFVLPSAGARPATLPASRSDVRAAHAAEAEPEQPAPPDRSRTASASRPDDAEPRPHAAARVSRCGSRRRRGQGARASEDLADELVDQFHGHSHRACRTTPPITQTGRSTAMLPSWRGTGFAEAPHHSNASAQYISHYFVTLAVKPG